GRHPGGEVVLAHHRAPACDDTPLTACANPCTLPVPARPSASPAVPGCAGAAIAVAFPDDEAACDRPAVGAPVVRVRPDGQRDLRRAALGAAPVGDPAADGRGPGRV